MVTTSRANPPLPLTAQQTSNETPLPLWRPSLGCMERSAMHRFMQQVSALPEAPADLKNLLTTALDDPVSAYAALHRWSVEHPEAFWPALLAFSGIRYEGRATPVIQPSQMPEARFFPDVRLNFAENLLRYADDQPALVSISEARPTQRLTYRQLNAYAARAHGALRTLGITAGDRVAGLLPNIGESVVAMLSATALGAVWSSSSPDFGVQGVLDRFGQIQPRILIAANAYRYNGKVFDCLSKLSQIARALPQLETIVVVPLVEDHPTRIPDTHVKTLLWDEFLGLRPDRQLGRQSGQQLGQQLDQQLDQQSDHQSDGASSQTIDGFERFGFNHPLYIMYSSGTTGVPKCIVHGAGGTLLQHAKELLLHTDLTRDDNIMYFTTCGWMMWNWLVSSLFVGSAVTLFDGSPSFPTLERLWELIDSEGITHFGTSPKFLSSCSGRVHPRHQFGLERLRVVLSTGAPLLPEHFAWVYSDVKADVQLSSISGGTDIIGCFMLGNPLLPVYAGDIQCIGLGMDVVAYDDAGRTVVGEKGELACRKPFASMPVQFWNDPEQRKYKKAYFHRMPHTWFHGDYIAITGSQGSAGGVVVYGRSDATLNPGGVRIGTSEIYRLVEALPDIDDSIVVGQPYGDDVRVVLFVKLAEGATWSESLAENIRQTIRHGATPRHVPHAILPVAKIPYTISGKKVELAVLEVLAGREPKNRDALADPSALDCYRDLQLAW